MPKLDKMKEIEESIEALKVEPLIEDAKKQLADLSLKLENQETRRDYDSLIKIARQLSNTSFSAYVALRKERKKGRR